MRAIAACAMLAVGAITMVVRVEAGSPATLTVRLYNTAGIPASELLAARHQAEAILRDISPEVAFRHCGPCDEPLQPAEVVVRVINAPKFNIALHPDAYGVTYVVRESNRGWLATVFPDRIDQAAARAGVDRGTLLGLVMAHEVGHLLLGSNYHGDSGLMVAEWPDALLARKGERWRFSTFEAATMRRVLQSIAG